MQGALWMTIAVCSLALFAVFLFATQILLSPYIQCAAAGAPLSLMDLLGMYFRKTLKQTVPAHIRLTKAGMDVPLANIESHIFAGGNVKEVVSALIIAKGAGETLSWETAAGLDLAGNVVAEVTAMLRASGKLPSPGELPSTV